MIPFNDIVANVDIVNEISKYVNLKKRGVNFKGLCPFHNEKTPSFTVSQEKQIFKCFGCGESGNVINFLVKHEKMTTKEAAEYLNNEYSLNLIEEEKDTSINVLYLAQGYFKMSKKGKEYLLSRGFSEDTIDFFKVGFSSGNFRKYALSKGVNDKELVEYGLIVEKNHITKYDRFINRVTWPIYNVSNKLIGFIGRTLEDSKNVPKYLNSPETRIYNKSRVLFNLNNAKRYINDFGYLITVEGQTDVMRMHELSYKNTVCSSGTSLTRNHIHLISNYTDTLYIINDGDNAGYISTERTIEYCFEYGITPQIVMLSEGDPDTVGKTNPDIIHNAISNPLNPIRFLYMMKSKEKDFTSHKFVSQTIESFKNIESSILLDVYIQELSLVSGIRTKSIYNDFRTLTKRTIKSKDTNVAMDEFAEIASIILSNPLDKSLHELFLKVEMPKEYNDLVEAVKSSNVSGVLSDYKHLISVNNSSDKNNYYQLKYLISTIYVKRLEKTRDFYSAQLNNISDDDKLIELLKKIDEIDKKIAHLTNL